MRSLAAFTSAVGIILVGSLVLAVEKDDLKLMQGTWVVVRAESNGKDLSEGKLKELGIVISIKDRTLTKTEEGRSEQADIVVRSLSTPKQIDIMPLQGEKKGETIMGVYTVDNDELKLAIRGKKDSRPTGFNTKPKSGDTTYIMKRQSAN